MKLLIESGSTKANWLLMDEGINTSFKTVGLNPYFVSHKDIRDAFDSLQVSSPEQIESVFFYGAGCANPEKCQAVRMALNSKLPKAEIEVHSDLLAAARALFGNNEGLTAIMGTGSNAAIYNGQSFPFKSTSLGYVLGDYGSGNHIGRSLIQAYFTKQLESELADKLQGSYNMNAEDVLHNVYKEKFPNRYLASFAPFAYEHKNYESIQKILKNVFQSFFTYSLLPLLENKHVESGLVGSVAYYFKSEIECVAQKNNIRITKVLKDPLDALANYHS